MKKRVVAYARVSSKSRSQAHSLEFQKNYWNEKLSTDPDYEYLGLFYDHGISGKTMKKRPSFMQMINKAFYISALFLHICTCLNAQEVRADTDSIAREQYLQEVVVHASYLSVKDNHIVGVPTQQQRRHAHTGYDLLRHMMLPGVTVIRKEGRVSTPAGDATLYINGREVSPREVESLRPKDIARIE